MDELNFQNWLNENAPSDNMKWKESFWNTYVLWRDKIFPMFTDEFYKAKSNYQKIFDEINNNISIVGTHTSKSILNPVVKIDYHGVTIIVRYNFMDYEIGVISDKAIHIPMKNLFSSKRDSFFYQGFPDEYIIAERYENNKCRFMANVRDHYSFYTFMYLLQRQIYLNSKEN